jgi:hypothetical protein
MKYIIKLNKKYDSLKEPWRFIFFIVPMSIMLTFSIFVYNIYTVSLLYLIMLSLLFIRSYYLITKHYDFNE